MLGFDRPTVVRPEALARGSTLAAREDWGCGERMEGLCS